MKNLRETIFQIAWLSVWLWWGIGAKPELVDANLLSFFGWFCIFFIGAFIIHGTTNHNVLQKYKKKQDREMRNTVERIQGKYIHHPDDDDV